MTGYRPEVPRDDEGYPLMKTGERYEGAALQRFQAAEAAWDTEQRLAAAELKAALEAREDIRALARVLARLAPKLTGQTDDEADALVLLAGRQDAIRLLRAAGFSLHDETMTRLALDDEDSRRPVRRTTLSPRRAVPDPEPDTWQRVRAGWVPGQPVPVAAGSVWQDQPEGGA
jgi:hypothetical protein